MIRIKNISPGAYFICFGGVCKMAVKIDRSKIIRFGKVNVMDRGCFGVYEFGPNCNMWVLPCTKYGKIIEI